MTVKLANTSSFPVTVQTQQKHQTSWIEGLESVRESLVSLYGSKQSAKLTQPTCSAVSDDSSPSLKKN